MKWKKSNVIIFMLAVIMTLQIILMVKVVAVADDKPEEIPSAEIIQPTEIQATEAPTEAPETVPVTEVATEPAFVYPYIQCDLSPTLQETVYDICEEWDVDFPLVMAVIFRESSFNPYAVSADGSSVGLMQINEINFDWLSRKLGITDFRDATQNVEAGVFMLHELFEKYHDPSEVLMAYNMGEGGAGNLWDQGIYSTAYSEAVLQTANKFQVEINET